MMELLDCDGHRMATALEKMSINGDERILANIASTLREQDHRIRAALQVANDLSESMDAVHRDRLALQKTVSKLSSELDLHRRQVDASVHADSFG